MALYSMPTLCSPHQLLQDTTETASVGKRVVCLESPVNVLSPRSVGRACAWCRASQGACSKGHMVALANRRHQALEP